jgi:hypothetical protein
LVFGRDGLLWGLSKVASMGSLDIGAPNLGSLGNGCITAATG